MVGDIEVNTLALQIAAYIVLGISSCMLLYAIIALIRYFAVTKKRNAGKEKSLIRWGASYAIIGIGGMIVFWFVVIAECFDPFNIFSKNSTYEENLLCSIFIAMFIILGFVLCLIGLNWQIELKKDSFVHTNFIGIKHTYSYEEIEIKKLRYIYRGYKDGKFKFTISFRQQNCDALCMAKRIYHNLHKKVEIDETDLR